jgi:hypothetical protein
MRLIQLKLAQVFSNGSVHFCANTFFVLEQIIFLEKDNKNFQLNKKTFLKNKLNSDYNNKFKTKYL